MTTTVQFPPSAKAIPYEPKPAPAPMPRLGAALDPLEVPNRQAAQMGGLFGFVWAVVFLLLLAFGAWKVSQELIPDAAPQPDQQTSIVQDEEKAPADSGQLQQPVNSNGGLECNVTNPYAGTAVLPAACK